MLITINIVSVANIFPFLTGAKSARSRSLSSPSRSGSGEGKGLLDSSESCDRSDRSPFPETIFSHHVSSPPGDFPSIKLFPYLMVSFLYDFSQFSCIFQVSFRVSFRVSFPLSFLYLSSIFSDLFIFHDMLQKDDQKIPLKIQEKIQERYRKKFANRIKSDRRKDT